MSLDMGYTLDSKGTPWGFGPVQVHLRVDDPLPVPALPRTSVFRDPQRVVPLNEFDTCQPALSPHGGGNFVDERFADMSDLADHFMTETRNNAGCAIALHRLIDQVYSDNDAVTETPGSLTHTH